MPKTSILAAIFVGVFASQACANGPETRRAAPVAESMRAAGSGPLTRGRRKTPEAAAPATAGHGPLVRGWPRKANADD